MNMTQKEQDDIIAECKKRFTPGVIINNTNLVKCRIKPKVTINSIFKFCFLECFIYRTDKEGGFTVWKEGKFASIVEKTDNISIKKNKINKKLLLLTH